MKHTSIFIIVFFLLFQTDASCQLQNGSIAPNWTLTDIEGNTYTLYDYLDQGKMVVLEFGETRCQTCWNYLNSGELETFWDQHGPGGLDDAMVFFIESAWYTGMDELLGLTPASLGNWVAACPFPLIDLPDGNNTANNYGVIYYPTIYAVCHDHTLYELGTVPTQDWIDFMESCNMEVQVTDLEEAICAGEGSVVVAPSGGFSPYTYQWDDGTSISSIHGLISGNYSVSITEGNGKISTLEIFIPGATEPLTLSDEIESALCYGSSDGNIYVDVEGGITGYQYAWNTGATSQNLVNISSNYYTVTVTDNLGCTLEQSFTVGQPDLLEVDAVTTPVSCAQPDGTITLSISGGVGNMTIYSSEGTINGYQIVGLSAGLISIEVEDENGCTWTDEIPTTYIDTPVVSFNDGDNIDCVDTLSTIEGFATGGYNEFAFQWSTDDGHIVSNPLASVIAVDAPGYYVLHVTDIISGCATTATSVVASGVIIPEVDAGPGIPINCENQQITLSAYGDSLNVIHWTSQNGSIVSGGDTYHPVIDAPGMYTIDVIHSATHCTNQDSVLITDESITPISIFQYLTSDLTLAVTDHSTGSNLSGWHWTFGDGQSADEPNPIHTYSASGTYEVCLSVQNGCGVSQSCQSIEVTHMISALTVDAVIHDVLCYGERTGSISLSVIGGSGTYQYNWTGPDTTYTSSSLDSITAGTYQLIVSDDLGNIFSGLYHVDQPAPVVLEDADIVHNLCNGLSNGSIDLTIGGGIPPYLYSWNGGTLIEENFLNQLPGGMVEAVVTDSNGCIFYAGIFTIDDPEAITVDSILITDASGPGASNGAIEISVQGGTPPYAVQWSNGASGSSITGLLPGTYDYTITDANGCQYISPDSLQVMFTTGINESSGHADISIMPNPTNGSARIEWKDIPPGNASITMMTVDGKILDTHTISSKEGTWQISSAGLSEGIYLILFRQIKEVLPLRLAVLKD